MKKITAILSALSVASLCPVSVFAQQYFPADWAKASFDKMISMRAVPKTILSQNYAHSISRRDFAELIHYSYNAFTEEDFNTETHHSFNDMSVPDASVSAVYALGIMQGDENNEFHPQDNITRQETAVVISNFYKVLNDDALTVDTAVLDNFNDCNNIAYWARSYVASVVKAGYMGDYDDGEFHPQDNVSIEQAVAMISRMDNLTENKQVSVTPSPDNTDSKPSGGSSSGGSSSKPSGGGSSGEFATPAPDAGVPTPTPSITPTPGNPTAKPESTSKPNGTNTETNYTLSAKCVEKNRSLSVSWNKITNASKYTITVTETRNHKRSDDIEPYTSKYTTENTSIDIPTAPGRTYKITVSAGDIKENLEFSTNKIINDKSGFILPGSMEEAAALMKEIEVNVWKINSNGEKYASTTSFTIHKDIADVVYDVFQEIFEGDEKFPILWVGGYAWRGGKSEHNWGMALDINPDQNYCIYTSGAVVGDFWLPYENPYSITPYGDVINAFENHGFTWGGDAWSGNIDYMHFSYFGT